MCDYCDYPVTDRRNPDYGKRKATPEAETGGELGVTSTTEYWPTIPRDTPIEDAIAVLIATHTCRAVLLGKLEELQHLPAQSRCPDCHTPHDSVSWRPTITDRIKALEAELKEIEG